MEKQTYLQEDEIDLRELFAILITHKKFIIIFTLLTTLCTALFVFTKVPTYEVTSNIQVAHFGDKLLISKPEILTKNLKIYFHAMDLKENNVTNKVGIVNNISQPKKLKNFIKIQTEATSNAIALKRNKDVVKYLQNLTTAKIQQIKINTNNAINKYYRDIRNIRNFKKINILQEIQKVKKQKIVQIEHKITFLKRHKIPQIEIKIKFNIDNLSKYNKYIKSIYAIYKQTKKTQNNALLTLSALQITNYQNLILNAQNEIENLRLQKEKILSQTIPKLNMQKQNMQNNTIRKLLHRLNIDLPAKVITLKEQIEKQKFNISPQNLQNSKVVGGYIVLAYPVKPKKVLILSIAFITSLILSIFIVFILNFIAKE